MLLLDILVMTMVTKIDIDNAQLSNGAIKYRHQTFK